MKAHEQAKAWRERCGISIADLARLSGYSEISLRWFEFGLTPPRTAKHIAGKQVSGKIKGAVWQRYRNVCAGIDSQLKAGKRFEW